MSKIYNIRADRREKYEEKYGNKYQERKNGIFRYDRTISDEKLNYMFFIAEKESDVFQNKVVKKRENRDLERCVSSITVKEPSRT